MNLLIITRTGDVHATAVATAVALQGHRVVLWATPDVANNVVRASVRVNSQSAGWHIGDASYGEDAFDVVWLRRICAPQVADAIHPDDREFVGRENCEFFEMLWAAVGSKAAWIHDYGGLHYGENKIYQLCAARRAGLAIPDTLFSQNPAHIKRFVEDIEKDGRQAIYKTFTATAWRNSATFRVKETSLVSSPDLSERKLLSLVPGIYQRRIEKDFELRVNLFGDNAIAVAIDSQSDVRGTVDWRALRQLDGFVTPFTLPDDIREKCVGLLNDMGLVMGCIDIVVDKDGTYQFLEVNQQGQFLWIEQLRPEVKLLDAFVRFLCQRAGHPDAPTDARYADVIASDLHKHVFSEFDENGYIELALPDGPAAAGRQEQGPLIS